MAEKTNTILFVFEKKNENNKSQIESCLKYLKNKGNKIYSTDFSKVNITDFNGADIILFENSDFSLTDSIPNLKELKRACTGVNWALKVICFYNFDKSKTLDMQYLNMFKSSEIRLIDNLFILNGTIEVILDKLFRKIKALKG